MLNRMDLKEYRMREGLSQRDIAWAAEPKWSGMFVSYLERGLRELTPARHDRYVKAIHKARDMKRAGTWDEPKIRKGEYITEVHQDGGERYYQNKRKFEEQTINKRTRRRSMSKG